MFWLVLLFIIFMALEWVFMVILFAKKYPFAGTVVLDIRRDATDSIYIESPRNLNSWKKYKALRFDVDIKQDFTRDGTRPDDPNYTGQTLRNLNED